MFDRLPAPPDCPSAIRSIFHDVLLGTEPAIGVDPGGRVIGVTEAAARLCGAAEAEFLGRDLPDFLRHTGPRSRPDGVLSFPGRNSLAVRIRLYPLRADSLGHIGYALLLDLT